MCVIVQSCWRAKKDYEVYVVRYMDKKKICSPFVRDCKWKLRKEYFIADYTRIKIGELADYNWFNVLGSLDDAERYLRAITNTKDPRGIYRIYKAFIPKSSLVIKGSVPQQKVWEGNTVLGPKMLKLITPMSEWEISREYGGDT